MLSGYITTLKDKQKLDVSSEGPSSKVSSKISRNSMFRAKAFSKLLLTLDEGAPSLEATNS